MVNRTVKPMAFSSKEKEEEERKGEEEGGNIKGNSSQKQVENCFVGFLV